MRIRHPFSLLAFVTWASLALFALPVGAQTVSSPPPIDPGPQIRQQVLRTLRLNALPPGVIPAQSQPALSLSAGGASCPISSGVTVNYNDSRIVPAHTAMVQKGASFPNNQFQTGASVSYSTPGADQRYNSASIRWMSDAPNFAVNVLGGSGIYNLWIDGQPMTRGVAPRLVNDGSVRWLQVNWGSDTQAYYVNAPNISTAGSGYAVGDLVTLTGGTSTVATVVEVLSISSTPSAGTPTLLAVINPGVFSATASTLTQASTTGSGTGLIVSPIWVVSHTTRQMHHYELWGSSAFAFGGLCIGPQDILLPWAMPAGPRLLIVGDSFTEGSVPDYPTGDYAFETAQLLNIADVWSSGVGATGWLETNGARPNLGGRTQDITNYVGPGDIVVIAMGINDQTSFTTGQVQAQVTSVMDTLLAADPATYFFIVGPWQGANSGQTTQAAYAAAIKAGLLAAVGYNTKYDFFIDPMNLIAGSGHAGNPTGSGNSEFYTSSDNTHWGQTGHYIAAQWLASQIVATIPGIGALQ